MISPLLLFLLTLTLSSLTHALVIKFYNGESNASDRPCTPTEEAAAKAAINGAVTIAENALAWVKEAEVTDVWQELFLVNKREDAGVRSGVAAKFQSVISKIPKNRASTMDHDTVPTGVVLFTCAPSSSGGILAGTLTHKTTPAYIDGTKIKLFPEFFKAPATSDLTPSIKHVLGVIDVNYKVKPDGRVASQSSIMLHEFFHADEIIGAPGTTDHKSPKGSAYGFDSAAALPAEHKIDNADNYMYAGIIGAYNKLESAKGVSGASAEYKALACFLSEPTQKKFCDKTITKRKATVKTSSEFSHIVFSDPNHKYRPKKEGVVKGDVATGIAAQEIAQDDAKKVKTSTTRATGGKYTVGTMKDMVELDMYKKGSPAANSEKTVPRGSDIPVSMRKDMIDLDMYEKGTPATGSGKITPETGATSVADLKKKWGSLRRMKQLRALWSSRWNRSRR